MRVWLLLALIAMAPQNSKACQLRWPNPDIAIPGEVRRFILAECHHYKGTFEENLNECILGEIYGYRAVVTMLMDGEDGEEAAERYRACRAGLGDFGGRFHRRRAECMGYSLGYVWRFEFSQRAALETDFASVSGFSSIVIAEQNILGDLRAAE